MLLLFLGAPKLLYIYLRCSCFLELPSCFIFTFVAPVSRSCFIFNFVAPVSWSSRAALYLPVWLLFLGAPKLLYIYLVAPISWSSRAVLYLPLLLLFLGAPELFYIYLCCSCLLELPSCFVFTFVAPVSWRSLTAACILNRSAGS